MTLINKYLDHQYQRLQFQWQQPYVLNCELSRPKKLNAWDTLMWTELRHFFERVADDITVRVIILTGSGRLFTAGLDLSEPITNLGCYKQTNMLQQSLLSPLSVYYRVTLYNHHVPLSLSLFLSFSLSSFLLQWIAMMTLHVQP